MTYDIKVFWEDTHYNFVMNKNSKERNWDRLCEESIGMFGYPGPDSTFDWEINIDSMTFRFKEESDALAFKLRFI
jgi:hypothetical protein